MALPSIMRKLFGNDGYGPFLKDEIVDRHISIQDWSNAYNYPVNTLVRGSDGLLYWSVAQSGPNVGGVQDPTTDDGTYWSSPAVKTVAPGDSSNASASTAWVNLWVNTIKPAKDYYVDPVNGDDSNDGLTAATAMQTIAATLVRIKTTSIPKNGDINIHLAQGIYTDAITGISGIQLNYIAPSGSQAQVPGIICVNELNASIKIYGKYKLTRLIQIARGCFLSLESGVQIEFNNLNERSAFIVYYGATLVAPNVVGATLGISFTGTNTFSYATVDVNTNGLISLYGTGTTISGSLTGYRYGIRFGSGITGTGSTTFFPGTIAGTMDSTSFYN